MSAAILSEAQTPGTFRCLDVVGDGEDTLRLKRLGICSGRIVEILQAGDPMVLSVIGTQIGLSRTVAQLVQVESIESASDVAAGTKAAHHE